MHGLSPSDGSRRIDWGGTSTDYADWRPNYPDEYYQRLQALGIGLPRQPILDLATGVGFLAVRFAEQGASVVGIDISSGQIETARRRAQEAGVSVDFRVAPAESTGLPNAAFDVVSASQCWLYFDCGRAITEVQRVLRPEGVLLISHFCWLPREDAIAQASEELVLKFNPDWTAANWSGEIPDAPAWSREAFDKVGGFVFDCDVPFTRESWRGRFRACRGVGATMSREEVKRFDAAHADLLAASAPEQFSIRHRIDAFLLRPRRS